MQSGRVHVNQALFCLHWEAHGKGFLGNHDDPHNSNQLIVFTGPWICNCLNQSNSQSEIILVWQWNGQCQSFDDWFWYFTFYLDLDQLLKPCKFLLFNVKVSNRGWDGLRVHKLIHFLRKNQKIVYFLPNFSCIC